MNTGRTAAPRSPRLPTGLFVAAVLLLLLAIAAFWPPYLSRRWAAIDAYTHVHALLGTAWLLLLIVQPWLIAKGFRAAHRAVGRGAVLVAPAFVVSGVLLAHFRLGRMSEAAYAKEAVYVYLPLSIALLFAVAAGLGIFWRRAPAVHARFMASTALLLLDPVLARLLFFRLPPLPFEQLYQAISFSLVALALFFLWRSLPAGAAGRTAYRNFCIGTVTVLALFFVLPHSGVWAAFTRGFRALPLT